MQTRSTDEKAKKMVFYYFYMASEMPENKAYTRMNASLTFAFRFVED
jgi:hypothetical protein